MMKYQTLIIVLTLLAIQGHHGWARFLPNSQPQGFDMLLLTQTWLPAICKTPDRYSLSHYCSVAHDYQRWSIHGLWPHKRNGIAVENCDDIPLNDEKIETMKEDLEHNWVDIFAVNRKRTNEMRNFWEKQWKKHGTCAGQPRGKTAQYEYFKKTLFLFKQYNMNNILANAGIVPGKEYTYYELSSKIEQQVGKECQIACYHEQDSTTINEVPTVQYLKEIRICFGRDFVNPTNCGRSRLPSCLRSSKIKYLDIPPPDNHASASTGPNQGDSPNGDAPKTNSNRFDSREYSFGIGSQGSVIRRGP